MQIFSLYKNTRIEPLIKLIRQTQSRDLAVDLWLFTMWLKKKKEWGWGARKRRNMNEFQRNANAKWCFD